MTPDEILSWRLEHGLTQQQMARALGLPDERTVRRWESGETAPPPYLPLALAEVARSIRT